jgi:alkanesulfonate monooxygenase SsuD/methylene tetrahydromethanopterin reductase-like flavin-dependent oxidoreductase (luciferase family)
LPLREVLDNRQRGSILDEALDVLVGLWSGEPFRYAGQHFHVGHVLQAMLTRASIWIGGGIPMRAAAPLRYGGGCTASRDRAG